MFRDDWKDRGALNLGQAASPRAPQRKKKDFWTDQISTGTGIGGALGGAATGAAIGSIVPGLGTAIGGLIGGIAGGAFGSGAGELGENFITGEEDKFKNVGQEALLGGVFSAPPVRLAKGLLTGGKALMGGGGKEAAKLSLEQALTQPGTLSRTISNTVGRSADNLALKSFNINDSSFLSNFKKNIGEDAGAFAKRLNFVGKSPEQITSQVYTPLQQVYKQAISNSNPIPKSDVLKGFQSIYSPLLKSVANDQRALGQSIKNQADEIMKRLPNQVNASDAYDYKILFDTLVDQKLTDSAGKLTNNVNKQIADVFRGLINKASASSSYAIDPATLPVKGLKATNLQQLGKELQGILEFADKAAVKENVGRGRNVIGMPEVLGGVMTGGALGNPLAAAGGFAATKLANSAVGERASMGLANKLSNSFGKERTPFSVGGVTGRLGVAAPVVGNLTGFSTENPQDLEGALLNQDLSLDGMNNPMTTQATMSNAPNMNSMDTSYQNQAQMSSPYPRENLLADIQRDPQNADKYIAYFQSLQEVFAPQGSDKPLTQFQQERVDLQNALGMAEGAVSGGSINYGPIGANVENFKSMFNMADPETLTFKNVISGLQAAITKARAGASLTDGEKKLLAQYTPNDTDSEQVVRSKLLQLRNLYGNSAPTGGGLNLEQALMSAGGY